MTATVTMIIVSAIIVNDSVIKTPHACDDRTTGPITEHARFPDSTGYKTLTAAASVVGRCDRRVAADGAEALSKVSGLAKL